MENQSFGTCEKITIGIFGNGNQKHVILELIAND